MEGYSPLLTGLIYWPALLTAIAASLLFGRLFNTRYVLVLPVTGMIALLAVAWIMTTIAMHIGRGEIFWITFLLGAGAGLTVSPGLFIAGLNVAPTMVGRAFSVVELLRLAGAFALAPAFLYFAEIFGMAPRQLVLGMHTVFWVSVGIRAFTLAITATLFFLGDACLHAPDLSGYLERKEEVIRDFLEMRFWVAQNKTVPVEILRILSQDTNNRVRSMVASKRKIPHDLQLLLAQDASASVRGAIAHNARVAHNILESLANDPDPTVQHTAKEKLAARTLP